MRGASAAMTALEALGERLLPRPEGKCLLGLSGGADSVGLLYLLLPLREEGSISQLLLSYLSGKLPLAVKGGYDFVDVRDVAAGILACTKQGLPGHGYILSGHYASIQDILEAAKNAASIRKKVGFLPIKLARLVAPFYEKWCLLRRIPLFFTPYAVGVLDSNGRFSRKAAESVLGFKPRSLESSIRDMVLWLKKPRQ